MNFFHSKDKSTGLIYIEHLIPNFFWTIIALNLPFIMETLRHSNTKTVDQLQQKGTETGSSTTENAKEILRLMWVVEVGFKLLSERGYRGGCINLSRKSIQKVESSKAKL